MSDCKSALVEARGDMEKAVEIILKKGLAKSAKKRRRRRVRGRSARPGLGRREERRMVEVNIQTDFAARNDEFKTFVGRRHQGRRRTRPTAPTSTSSPTRAVQDGRRGARRAHRADRREDHGAPLGQEARPLGTRRGGALLRPPRRQDRRARRDRGRARRRWRRTPSSRSSSTTLRCRWPR